MGPRLDSVAVQQGMPDSLAQSCSLLQALDYKFEEVRLFTAHLVKGHPFMNFSLVECQQHQIMHISWLAGIPPAAHPFHHASRPMEDRN